MKRAMIAVLCITVVLVLAAAPTWAGPPYEYTVTDLGLNNWTYSINNSGQIAGITQPTWGVYSGQACRYDAGATTPTLLGTLSGDNYGLAFGINAGGQIVGASYLHAEYLHPVLYSGGTVIDLRLNSDQTGCASGINNAGTVVGYIDIVSGTSAYAFQKTSSGTIENLNALLPNGSPWTLNYAYAINNNDQIVGEGTYNGASHAFLFKAGVVTDLGSYGGSYGTYAMVINDSGTVVGQGYDTSDKLHAWSSTSGDLGSLVSGGEAAANNINSAGVIVGFSDYAGTQNVYYHAFVIDGQMKDLNSLIDPASGATLVWADGINDLGQIVATGYGADGGIHSFLLTPEPATMALLALGGIGMLARRRRGK